MHIRKNIAVSESGFVFDPSTGESFTFNPTGHEIFRLLMEGKSPGEITEIISLKYEIDEHSFERYFLDFIQMLKQYQLIENE